MATTFPTYPATTFEQAVELAIFSSNQLHNIINADATSTVETEDGDISSVRKALVDNLYFKSPVAWSEGNTSTVFNQLYYFYQSGVVNGYYYAPTATESNPVEMNSTPVDDDNWLLYSAITQQSPSEVYPYTYTATADTTSITTGYDFDTAIVTVNGVVLVPDVDYTITDSTTITLTNPIGVDTDTGLGDVLFAYLGKIVQGSGADYATYTTLAKSTGASIIGTSEGTLLQALNNRVRDLGNYEDSVLTIENRNTEIRYNGLKYYVSSSVTLPFTTTGTTSTTWEIDKSNFVAVGDTTFREDLIDDSGVTLIGSNTDGLYLGCFFDSWNNNEVFIVTSEDGYNWTNPTRIYYEGAVLTVRDPTLIYYKDKFVLLEGGTIDVADCYLYISDDLINWTRSAIIFNSDKTNTVFSSTRIWSNGGGTVATSKSWAQEPCIDADGNLYIMASLYTGIDTTAGSTTDNMFKIGISKCSDWDNLTFEYPTLMNLYADSSTSDVYSRIDPSLHYDTTNSKYVLGVKRENYGYVEVFTSSTILGNFTKVASISPPSTAPATTMYFEGPSVFGLRTGGVGISVDDYYGPTGQWLSTSTDLATFTDATNMRMPFARHGSIRYYNDLPFSAQYYIAIKQLRGSTIRVNNERPRFTHYTDSRTIIPVADTIYWTATSALTLTISVASSQPAKRFYVFLNTSTTTAYTTISGAINGGDAILGYGINNYNLVEFIYNATDKKYIANARYNPSALYTSGTLQANNVRSNTGLDLGYNNTTAASRQITFYPLGSNSPSANINSSSTSLSLYSSTKITLAATTFVDTSGKGFKFPSIAVGSLPSVSTYQYVELMCTGMSTSTSGTTISPTTQKVYSDGTNWRLSSDPTIIVA